MYNSIPKGHFYLGKEIDTANGNITDKPVFYDSKHLVTHGICFGMTGSGKTGICISLLEEAANQEIPSIIIDPKGDITNLLLTFPEFRAEDFKPWVNPEDASRKNMDLDSFAEHWPFRFAYSQYARIDPDISRRGNLWLVG